jgi:precorrin-6Y C5,15-methyltransferase (decarboxylating)
MSPPWLTVIGVGANGLDSLPPYIRAIIDKAEVLVGSDRLLAFAPEGKAERLAWPRPFSPMIPELATLRGKRVVVLATGDPLNYGIARKLLEHFPIEELCILPHLSSFSLAAARMGWSLPDVETFTLHGRDDCAVEPFIQPNSRFLALTEGDTSVREVARRLVARGYPDSPMTALEHMGGAREARCDFTAVTLPEKPFADLLTLAVHCVPGPTAQILPRTAGLPDAAFQHDGQLTKREVRAATVAALGPTPHALLWDVGAGCGSVAIEWMRAAAHTRAIAFERDETRLAMIARNHDCLGTPMLKIIPGDLPDTLQGQPAPDAIFIGGDVANPALFEACWATLKPLGRLVANAVTVEGEVHLAHLQAEHGGELVRVGIEYLTQVGSKRAMKPRMTVTQWRVSKP